MPLACFSPTVFAISGVTLIAEIPSVGASYRLLLFELEALEVLLLLELIKAEGILFELDRIMEELLVLLLLEFAVEEKIFSDKIVIMIKDRNTLFNNYKCNTYPVNKQLKKLFRKSTANLYIVYMSYLM